MGTSKIIWSPVINQIISDDSIIKPRLSVRYSPYLPPYSQSLPVGVVQYLRDSIDPKSENNIDINTINQAIKKVGVKVYESYYKDQLLLREHKLKKFMKQYKSINSDNQTNINEYFTALVIDLYFNNKSNDLESLISNRILIKEKSGILKLNKKYTFYNKDIPLLDLKLISNDTFIKYSINTKLSNMENNLPKKDFIINLCKIITNNNICLKRDDPKLKDYLYGKLSNLENIRIQYFDSVVKPSVKNLNYFQYTYTVEKIFNKVDTNYIKNNLYGTIDSAFNIYQIIQDTYLVNIWNKFQNQLQIYKDINSNTNNSPTNENLLQNNTLESIKKLFNETISNTKNTTSYKNNLYSIDTIYENYIQFQIKYIKDILNIYYKVDNTFESNLYNYLKTVYYKSKNWNYGYTFTLSNTYKLIEQLLDLIKISCDEIPTETLLLKLCSEYREFLDASFFPNLYYRLESK